jgi:collagenase-like PrtC family protease
LAVYNSEAIRFLLDNYKVNKIILSREVTLKEIEQILTEFPDVTFEVFGEGDFCRYNNGLCFAEHKYTTRDICTVVVNDLIIKKRYHPDFKKIILDETLSNIEKIEKLSTSYQNVFEEIDDILERITI